jgi:hypothetical protein
MSFKNNYENDKSDTQKSNYKNLKVLPKNISKEDLDAVMKNYCVALNVKCGFCHIKSNDKWDFISDEKDEKIIARKMQKMTNAINKKYFGENTGTIGCMTCHNGKKNPNDMN